MSAIVLTQSSGTMWYRSGTVIVFIVEELHFIYASLNPVAPETNMIDIANVNEWSDMLRQV